jgi:ASC-1-like (ASCH) protein
MNDEEKKQIIKDQFNKMAGKNIKIGSCVVRYGDRVIYEVVQKDSKLVKCRVAMDFFSSIKPGADEVIFNKLDVCLYFELFKSVNRIITETKFEPVLIKEGRG